VSYVHLHCHTEYSLLDGCNRIPEMVARAQEMGMPALAMTDHGVMSGAVTFYKACKKAGIKPLIGCEIYMAQRGRHDREPRKDDRPFHLTLLAKDREGYRNLTQLVSAAHLEGYYYKPRADRELLARHSKGLVALSGCLRGEVNDALMQDDPRLAAERLGFYRDVFGEDLFVELMDHGLPEQRKTNPELVRLARDFGLKTVATNDAHYLTRDDASLQDVLVCIQTGKNLDDQGRMKFFAPEFYLKSGEEMLRTFNWVPEAVHNTLEVAERCQLEMDLESVYLPSFPVPGGGTAEDYLRELCREGFIERFGNPDPGPEYQARLQTELDVIIGKGFADYFLLVWDFIRYSRSQGIPVGPGRGSAAGSLVAYLIGITQLDPLPHQLLFERFLNPERTELPDIDTDFCVERRGEVIEYCRQKYGTDRVAQIVTFNRMKARAAIRDVGRVLGVPLPDVDRIAKAVPADLKVTLESALEAPDFRAMYDGDPTCRKLVDLARRCEGLARNAGIHAAGVVIASQPLSELVPLQRMNGDEVVCQFDMNDSATVGLVKMDFLGLRNLTVINDCLRNIERSRGEKLNLDNLTFDDPATYELLGNADTNGVFQLESDGMKRYLRSLKPDRFSDVVAFLALYRPGPLKGGVVDEFIRKRHGKGGEIVYPHPKLEPILKETYGFFIYQEQVMLTANVLAGYTMAMADSLRKAMGKKKMDVMEKHRKIFVDGAVERGVDAKVAADIFVTMENFAAYGFNKSHSAAYAVVTYQTAWLKTHYRPEYMAALLTSVMSNIEKVSFFIAECSQSGLEVLRPDVNESGPEFTVVPAGIRWGMAAVRNVGRGAVDCLVAAREKEGPFQDLADLCARVDLRQVNKKVLEGLIKAGAMDGFGETRATLLANLDCCLDHGQRVQKEAQSGQFGLFDEGDLGRTTFAEVCKLRENEFDKRVLLDMEKEMLGIYLSDSPLSEYRELLTRYSTHRIADLSSLGAGASVAIAGMVTSVRKIVTRFKTQMAFLQVEDFSGTTEVTLRPQAYEKFSSLCVDGAIVVAKGVTEVRQARQARDEEEDEEAPAEEVKLTADEMLSVEKMAANSAGARNLSDLEGRFRGLNIRVQLFQGDSLSRLRDILLRHRGAREVFLHLESPQGTTVLHLPEAFGVEDGPRLVGEVEDLLGRETVWVN